jgi:large subunit ribosomal protein L30
MNPKLPSKLKVKQLRSAIGTPDAVRETLRGLGLRGPNRVVVVANTAAFRGAIKKVIHLVSVETVSSEAGNG